MDYGNVRVGLAVSDELGITAQGLDTLTINNNEKLFLNEIKKLVDEHNISEIVIGYPKNMDGTVSEKAVVVDRLIPKLERLSNLNVEKWDERLTTVSAYKTMQTLNISQKNKNKYADKLAATYILEGYLNKIRRQNY
ncbi:MAG: Holliday junction resolvase RuvX [Clostridia bacterium]|nr:Holliday junction resolvase RuvX [Clostridia bacterium]